MNVDVIPCAVEASFYARAKNRMRRGMSGCHNNNWHILLQS